jgi:bile acid-coenzyme A ligase
MPLLSYGRALRWWAERSPGAVAVVFGDAEITRAELLARGHAWARAFAERGVGEGDLVTVALPNEPAFFEACLGAWVLGATPNPISARLPEAERRAIVETAAPAVLVGAEPGSYGDIPCIVDGASIEVDPDAPLLREKRSACARAMTSGGSTGRPKVIIDRSPAEVDPEIAENLMQTEGTILTSGPLYHAGPFITSWQALLSGGRVILMERFDPEACLAAIEAHRVDWVLFVPTMMQRIWRLPDEVRERYDVSSLRAVMSSGAASPQWLKRAWIDWLGPEKIFEAYGGSERIGGTMISGTEWLEHPGSVGRPTGDRKIRILDEEGNEKPAGEIGLVYMMPPGGQGSTYAYKGATARATGDGWETLGDLGYLDSDGYLYLVDRETDMVVTGGANVYPAEVEEAIDAHPAVRSSAVIGLPDDDLGQRVHAIVDAPDTQGGVTEADLRGHLAELLVRYKIPRSFEFVTEPLRDDAGKVRRSALREARLPDRSG